MQTTDSNTTDSRRKKRTRRQFARNMALGSILVVLSVWGGVSLMQNQGDNGSFFAILSGNEPSNAKKAASRRAHLAERTERNLDILNRDARLLWDATDGRLDNAFAQMERSLRRAGEQFSNEKITRRNISLLISYMAMDHFDEGAREERWFSENMDPYMVPVIAGYQRRLQNELAAFNRHFALVLDDFNKRVFADLKDAGVVAGTELEIAMLRQILEPVFEQCGIRYGIGIGGGTVATIGGLGYYSYAKLMRVLTQRLRLAAVRVLRPALVRATGRALATAGASSFPLAGAAVAIGGSVWTGYDVYQMRGATQESFAAALEEGLQESRAELDSDIKQAVFLALEGLRDNRQSLKDAILAQR